MKGAIALIGSALVLVHGAVTATCPKPIHLGGARVYIFEDGSIAMRTPLHVNPDGTIASYTVGDHGFTYVANGMSLWEQANESSCEPREVQCREKFLAAELKGFDAGTLEFCVFAMEVEPISGKALTDCGRGRKVIGNGKGRPKTGDALETVTGAQIIPYRSMTALMHRQNGKHVYINSANVPSLVTSRVVDRGHIAWVRSAAHSREAFAVVGDVGPEFGEGSLALHQILRYGELTPQKPGPIPAADRCQESEISLKAPYESRPDDSADICRPNGKPRTDTDIRAYGEITSVESILLSKAAFNVVGNRIDEELTVGSIAAKVATAGYTAEKIKEMAACIR